LENKQETTIYSSLLAHHTRSFVIEVEEHPGDHSENILPDLLFFNNFNELSFKMYKQLVSISNGHTSLPRNIKQASAINRALGCL